jgi:hypothetical protein
VRRADAIKEIRHQIGPSIDEGTTQPAAPSGSPPRATPASNDAMAQKRQATWANSLPLAAQQEQQEEQEEAQEEDRAPSVAVRREALASWQN